MSLKRKNKLYGSARKIYTETYGMTVRKRIIPASMRST